jgi:MFS family permease
MHASLWRQPDFLKFWLGQSTAQVGQQVAQVAIPLLATLTLHATPGQMGLLLAAETLPFALFGLPAGVLVDRSLRRPILVGADALRALLLSLLPVVALAGRLDMAVLCAAAFGLGAAAVFFDVAYQSYLPTLVERRHLVDGNGKLESARAIAQIGGPGLGGALLQWVSAPFALALTGLSFAVSASSLLLVKKVEIVRVATGPRPAMGAQVREGLRAVLHDPLLRPIAIANAWLNLCGSALLAVFAIYLVRDLHLAPAAYGLVMAMGAPGALLGAMAAGPAARRFRPGPAIVGAGILMATALASLPFAVGPYAIASLVGIQFLEGLFTNVYNVNHIALRQAITPDALLGRVNASMRWLVWGTMPIGALLGGWAGDRLGVAPTLTLAALAHLATIPVLWFSPLRHLQAIPEHVSESA